MKLLIRNLARSTTEAELRTLFEGYGSIQSCSVVMDKKTGDSKGFGFVEMPKPGEAKAATKILNGQELGGNKIRVKKAESKENTSSQDPLHAITLEKIVTQLEDKYGWEGLGSRINIKCFTSDPSISSSLKFLRKTPWARKKVEALYLDTNWSAGNVWAQARKKKP
jgi:RNA recognition motif-containing protein